jgi:hypothetical protein
VSRSSDPATKSPAEAVADILKLRKGVRLDGLKIKDLIHKASLLMPALAIDASATLPWCFADEATEATNALLARLQTGDEAVAPSRVSYRCDTSHCTVCRPGLQSAWMIPR